MDKDVLLQVGLTPRESDAYLALLQLREALVVEISKRTKENRTHLYDTLNSLIQKGLVSYVIKNGKKYFKPSPPEKLLDYLNEKQKIIEENLPQLRELYKPNIKGVKVEVFEGIEGIKTILNDVLREKKEWLCLGSTGRSPEILPFFLEHFHKKRIKEKVELRVIYNDDSLGRKRGEEVGKRKYAKVRYMPKSSPTTTYIYGKKIVIIVWEKDKLVGIMVEDEDIANSYRSYFESIWQISKP